MLLHSHTKQQLFSRRSFAIFFVALSVVSLLIFTQVAPTSQAATIAVTTFADSLATDGECSLREAIINANDDALTYTDCTPGSSLDVITLSAGTYTLSIAGTGEDLSASGDLDLNSQLTITGAGMGVTVINGGGIDRVFELFGSTTATIEDLTITGGSAPQGAGIDAKAGSEITFNRVSIEGNTATNATLSGGGGINASIAAVTLNDSQVVNNSTGGADGGGIDLTAGTTLTINRSTISGNSAPGGSRGGGINNYQSSTIINNSTISGNTAGIGYGISTWDDGVYESLLQITSSTLVAAMEPLHVSNFTVTSSVKVDHTILVAAGGNTCTVSVGSIDSLGYNIATGINSDVECGLEHTHDQPNTDPLLGALTPNGGPTETHVLGINSPATNAGDPNRTIPATDQRGFTRVEGGVIDIGAFELGITTFTVVAGAGEGADANPGDGVCADVGGDCTLRAAVDEANALSDHQAINIPAGSYTLSNATAGDDANLTGDLDLTGDVTIIGAGAGSTQIFGDGADRMIDVLVGVRATLIGLQLTDGVAQAPSNGGGIQVDSGRLVLDAVEVFNNQAGGHGGGIYSNGGDLIITNSMISSNSITAAFSNGGGIYINGAADFALVESSINDNSGASQGGGIFGDQTGTFLIDSSSIVNNTSTSEGGGLDLSNFGNQMYIVNSTISGNTSDDTGGIFVPGGTLNIDFSTIADNEGTGGFNAQNLFYLVADINLSNSIVADPVNGLSCSGNVMNDLGNNIEFPNDGCLSGADYSDPLLQPLALKDGRLMHAINFGSPAVDNAGATCGVATDGAGVTRPFGAGCDIGAYELDTTTINFDGLPLTSGQLNVDTLNSAYAPMGVTFDFAIKGEHPSIPSSGFWPKNPGGLNEQVATWAGGPASVVNFAYAVDFVSVNFISTDVDPSQMYAYDQVNDAADNILNGGLVDSASGGVGILSVAGSCIRSVQLETQGFSYTIDDIVFHPMSGPDSDGDGIVDECDGITVNTIDDTDDGTCDATHCSLREAINAANASPNGASSDEIHFDIPGAGPHIVQLTTALPPINEAVIIDGSTDPDGAIVLDGGLAGPSAGGLILDSGGSSISGLEITNFSDTGITVLSGSSNSMLGNSIYGNGGLGIDLGGDGVTRNDFFDGDTGPNSLQNTPVLQRALVDSGNTVIQGYINSEVGKDIEIELYANSSCDPTFHGEGEIYLVPVYATTDVSGYASFQATIPGTLSAGTAISALARRDDNGDTSEFSRCIIVGPNNDTWVNAYPISLVPSPTDATELNGEAEQYVTLPGQTRWFRFPVAPDSKVIVELSDLPADYDLILFKDIATKYAEITVDSPQTLDDLRKLTAEFAPDMFSPDMFSPDMFSPDMFSPDMFSPDMFSPDMFSPDMFSPDMFSPDMFSPDMFSPDMFSPDMFSPDMFSPDMFSPDMFSPDMFSPDMFSPDMFSPDQRYYSNAQTQSAIAASGFNGTAPETVIANSWDESGDFYVSVSGRNGVFTLANPFSLDVTVLGGECVGVSTVAVPTVAGIAAGLESLILVDYSRMAGDLSVMQNRLAALAAATTGTIVNVGLDATIQTLNQQADDNASCVYAKNLVAYGIKAIVDAYRDQNPGLKYITIVGNDDVIPFFRYPDQALLANETGYQPPVDDLTASQASLRRGYFLTQDTYGAAIEVDRRNTSLPVPELSVGRLVESTDDVVAVIDAYLDPGGFASAPLIPEQALVVGYDFMDDAANAVEAQLTAGMITNATIPGTVNTLIDAATVAPVNGWKADDLRGALLESGRHDLVFLAGHFSASSALAADYESRLLASEIINSPLDMRNTIIFSNGCHSGYNIVNEHGIPSVTLEPDWAQAFAAKGATLIGGTGYQYGDSEFIEYNERLYVEFSRELRRGNINEPVAIGDAFVRAKQIYLAETAEMRPIHEKALLVSTLFGLPMLEVNMPGERYNPTPSSSIVPSTIPEVTDPGQSLGLTSVEVSVNPITTREVRILENVEDQTLVETTFYRVTDSERLVINPGEPILPLKQYNVTVPNTVLRGVGFRGGSYVDNVNEIPLTGAATTELRSIHIPFIAPVFHPVLPWDVNYFDQLADSSSEGITRLGIMPAQYRSNSAESVDGTIRVFGSMDFKLFYNANIDSYVNIANSVTNIPALASQPNISSIFAEQYGTDIVFETTVVGDPSAGIQEVWVTYTGLSAPFYGSWQSLILTQDTNDSRLWRGSLDLQGASADDLRFIVQAVNGVGLVSLAANKGAYYVPGIDPGEPSGASAGGPLPAPVELTLLTPAASGPYGTSVMFTALLTSNGTPLEGEPIEFGLTTQRKTVLTDSSGQASVELTLVDEPTTDTVRVSYAGAPGLAAAGASTDFRIEPATTNLTLLTTTPTFSTNGQADLSIALTSDLAGSSSRPLPDKAVLIVVRDSGGTVVFAESVITDLFGNANLLTTPLALGSYTVNAYFADRVVLPMGVWDTRTARYESVITPNPANGDPPLTLIQNTPPTANAGGGYVVQEGGSVLLDATASSDPNPGQALNYSWDLNSMGSFESLGVTVTFGARSIDGPDMTTVTLQVCDVVGDCDISSATVTIDNSPPTILSVANDGPVGYAMPATITVTATDPVDPLEYWFDCDNNNVFEIGPQVGNTAVCNIFSVGDETVNVKVTDDDGGEALGSTLITVEHIAPPTVNAGSDRTFFENDTVSFSGSLSDSAPGTYTFSWDFGDGSTASGTLTPSHTYAAPGTYLVTLTVTNNLNQLTGSDSLNVTVLNDFLRYCVFAVDEEVGIEMNTTLVDCGVSAYKKVDVKEAVSIDGDINSRQEEIKLHKDVDVDGNISAADKVIIEESTTISGDVASGDKVELKKNVYVQGSVLAGDEVFLEQGASVDGTISEYAPAPVFPTFTSVQFTLSSGSQKITVNKNKSEVLTPGDYGELELKQGGTLTLNDGFYSFSKIKVGKAAMLNLDLNGGSLQIDVTGKVEFEKNVSMNLVSGSSAGDVVFRIAGDDVKFKKGGTHFGIFLAPEASITVEKGNTFVGVFYGSKVELKKGVQLTGIPTDELPLP